MTKSEFSLDYLKDISKALIGSTVAISLRDDHPISMCADPVPGLKVKYLLAPHIEEEDSGVWL